MRLDGYGKTAALLSFVCTVSTLMTGCGSSNNGPATLSLPNAYSRTNLVADKAGFTDSAGPAVTTDANLVNPWGIAFNATGPFWISDNGTGVATLYDGSGTPKPLVVSIPTPGSASGGAVTGQVANATQDFQVATGTPAHFIFSTEDGTIAAWAAGTNAVLKADRSAAGAVYKGLAIAGNSAGNFLYATDFHNAKVDVFDKSFAPATLSGSFSDPSVPPGFAPFGIANIGGSLLVTFAKQDSERKDDVAGAGNGVVDVFNTDGVLIRRLASGSAAGGSVSALDSPWGLALAPADFGRFSGDLLVGNFGSGQIDAFEPGTGAFLGQLETAAGQPVVVPGLWAITFGNGAQAGPSNVLFFTAGTNSEQDGLFGSIQPISRKGSAKSARKPGIPLATAGPRA